MKSQYIINVVIAFLLLSVSGAALARNDCPEGSIVGGVMDEIVITEFVSCLVLGTVVKGNVIVRNADQFTMKGGIVNGNVWVSNVVSSFVSDVNVNDGNLVTSANLFTNVLRNVVSGGNILVIDGSCDQTQTAAVVQNLIYSGTMRVNCNEKADVKENKITDGDIICNRNDHLDSKDNDAFGGKVDCSRNLFN